MSNPEDSKESAAEQGEKKEAVIEGQQEKKVEAKAPVFFKQRDEKRKEKDRLAEELSARDKKIESLEARLSELAKRKDESEDGSDYAEKGQQFDPSAIEKRVEENLINRFAEANHKKFLADSAAMASNWLFERSHLQDDPEFAKAVEQAITKDHSDIADVNPMKAAKLAYNDVCEARGVSPDYSKRDVGSYASQGLKGGNGGSNGGGKWTPEKAQAYLDGAKPGTAEYAKRLETLCNVIAQAKP